MVRQLDIQERTIIRALIRNPRASDNAIAKQTGVPVMSVNRKRKRLEEQELIRYYTELATDSEGIGIFDAMQLYVIKLRAGITKKDYMDKIESDAKFRVFNTKFISSSYLGEKDGQLALVIVLHAHNSMLLTDEFNGKIVPYLTTKFGDGAIQGIDTVPLTSQIRVLHNYLPALNMKKGTLGSEWPDEFIFVDDYSLDAGKNESVTKYIK